MQNLIPSIGKEGIIMAKARKDHKGRALRKGETYQKKQKRYVYTYVDPFGKRQYIYAKDLMKLREREDTLIKNQLDGLDVYAMGKADLNFVFDRYISTKTEIRGSTRYNYMYTYNQYVRDGFGTRKLGDIKYSDVMYFYLFLMEEKGLGVSTVENVQTVLHPAFQLAVRDGIIRNNPSDGVMAELKKKTVGRKSGIRHALTVEQQKAFVDYLMDKPKECRWKNLFVFLLGTGCRIGEVIGIRWEDVDFEKRVISINHNFTYYPRTENSYKCEFALGLPKTEAGVREIPMLPTVYDALMDEKTFQNETGMRCQAQIEGMSNFIFFNRFYNIHNPQAVNRAIKRISEDYNREEVVKAKKEKRDPIILPHFTCHSLRHTFCSRLCENETNVKLIQEIMGHKDIQTTLDIYAEITGSKKQESFEKLASKLDFF